MADALAAHAAKRQSLVEALRQGAGPVALAKDTSNLFRDLAHGVMPAVVPQLKTITLGGAVAGVGIESSSHRHGLVHDTMLELDVLVGDGRVVSCTPHNAHADLFFGFPNSYGTLGYALRVKAKTLPVKPFVRLEHLGFSSAGE